MRTFEALSSLILIFGTIATYDVYGNYPIDGQYALVMVFAYISIAMAVLHAIVEGIRWQMIPTYLVMWWMSQGHFSILPYIAIISISFVLATVLPVPMTPSFRHGTHTYIGTGVIRIDGIKTRVWYPASIQHEEANKATSDPELGAGMVWWNKGDESFVASWIPSVSRAAWVDLLYCQGVGWAKWCMHYVLRLGIAHAHPSASPALSPKEGFPLVLMSHGLTAAPFLYASLGEALASQGMVVCAPYHTDGSCCDRLEPLPSNADVQEEALMRRKQLERRLQDLRTLLAFLARPKEEQPKLRHRSTARASAPLPESTAGWSVPSSLWSRVNLRRVGMVGHSFGGATALMMSAQEDRIQVVCAMDPWSLCLPDDMPDRHVPTLCLCSDQWRGVLEHPKTIQLKHTDASIEYMSRRLAPAYERSKVVVHRAGHNMFSDTTLLGSWVALLFRAGWNAPIRWNISCRLIAEFCAQQLVGQGTDAQAEKFLWEDTWWHAFEKQR